MGADLTRNLRTMENAEKMLPLLVLLSLGAGLVVLLVRAKDRSNREGQGALLPPLSATPAVAPTEMAIPGVPSLESRVESTTGTEVAVSADSVAVEKKKAELRRASRRQKRRVEPAATTSPVDQTVQLLQDKNALTTAFLLREILGPPVSRRQR